MEKKPISIIGEVVKLSKSGSEVYVHTTIGHLNLNKFPNKNVKIGEKVIIENAGNGWIVKN